MSTRARVYRLYPKKAAHIKIERLIIPLGLLILVLLWVTAPTSKLLQEKADNALLKKQLTKQQLNNRTLQNDIKKLQMPSYIELKARSDLGLVKEGEIQYYVLVKKIRSKAKPKVESRSWRDDFLNFLEEFFVK